MALKNFGILSPVMGIAQNFPSIFLRDAFLPDYLSDTKNIFFKDGEIHRVKMRTKEFTQALPDRVLLYSQYWQKDLDWWLILCTKRDIAYRDTADKLVYITPKYNTGKAQFTNGDATVVGSDSADFTNLKKGDFITIGTDYSTDDTWCEILSITDGSNLELTTVYAGTTTGAVAYQARTTYSGTNTTFWETVTFNDEWIATNGVDAIQVWTGTNQCADLGGSPPIAKHITVFENYIVVGNLSATDEPYTYQWPAIGTTTGWSTGDSGSAEIDDYYTINGFGHLHGFLIILTERTLEKVWLRGGDLVFNRRRITSDTGCYAPQSIILASNGIYFYSSDNTFRCYTGFSWGSISDEIDKFMKNLHPEYDMNIYATYIEQYNLILWAVPDSTSTGRKNRVVMYDTVGTRNRWTIKHMEVCSFGSYEVEAQLTWDALPYATWDDWDWEIWNSRKGFESAPHDLCSDYSGYTYRLFSGETDDGDDFTGEFVLATDLSKDKKSVLYYKRLPQLKLLFRNEGSGTVDVYAKKDYETGWESLGSVSLDGSEDILFLDVNCDLLAKNFLFKFSAENKFRFLGILFPEFDILGVR